MPGEPVRIVAPAKLTLSLRVTGVRPDGYHEIDAVMTTASEPFDVVELVPAERMSIVIDGPFASGAPADATNLAWRAAEVCGATLAIRVRKGIPAGAGLGGGSADAAAVLVALGADPVVGAALGADIPFCMAGGAARVRGVGEIVEPATVEPRTVVIATPRLHCETAAVYRAWDALGGPSTGPGANDLEPAAHAVEPRLAAFKEAVEGAADRAAVLAGSGSSYAVVCADPGDGARIRSAIATAVDGWAWLATCPAGDAASGSS
ncbi:MAG: 4-(cytidine 5'-diphospho)-2-C-methyl-D-erythritol kinase [Actinomycetota bacterium]